MSVSLLYDSNVQLDAVRLSGSSATSLLSSGSAQPQYFFGPKLQLSFLENVEYTLEFDATCKKTTSFDALIEVYVVGTAFPNKSSLGTKIGELVCAGDTVYQVFDRQYMNITAPLSGTAYLRFVVYSGQWHIGNVRFAVASERGFSVDATNVLLPIVGRRFENLQFKAELLDFNGNPVPVTVSSSYSFFNGGNVVLKGADHRIDGILTVSGTGDGPTIGVDATGSYIGIKQGELATPVSSSLLPTYSGKPVVTMYSSSNGIGFQIVSGIPGGSFMDFNTSTGTLNIRGDISLLPGTALSQSISNISGSSSDSGSLVALAQIQQLVSGSFLGGTFINGNFIFSPIIAGTAGYFSSQFGVGNIAGGNGIILTALGYSGSTGTPVPNAPAIYIGRGRFADAQTPFLVASSSTGPVFSLGNLFTFQSLGGGNWLLNGSGSFAFPTGSGYYGYKEYTDLRDSAISGSLIQAQVQLSQSLAAQNILNSASITSLSASQAQVSASLISEVQNRIAADSAYSSSQALMNTRMTASIASISSSNAQVSASLISEIQNRIASASAYSASQAIINAALTASVVSVSSSNAQVSASLISEIQNRIAAVSAYSSSQSIINSQFTASIVSVSSSNAQVSASLVSETQNRIAAASAYSSSQSIINSQLTASIVAVSASNAQVSASLISEIQNRISADTSYSSSAAIRFADLQSQILAITGSSSQSGATQSIVDNVNRIILPTSTKSVAGLYLEATSMGFWQPHPSGSGISSSNFPVVINSNGQMRIANSASWAGDSTNGSFQEMVGFANGAFVVRSKNLLLDTPGLQLAGSYTSSAISSFIKLGANASAISLSRGAGLYVDGAGNFRVGSDTSGSDYIQLTPGNALFISSSFFALNSNIGGNALSVSPFAIALGNPIPSTYNPTSAVGFYANRNGQVFFGSGSVGATAGAGTGSWVSFGGTDLNIRAQKLFLNSNGLIIQGADTITSASNVIKLGPGVASMTLNNNQGFYADGAANWRVGSDVSGSDYVQFVANSSLTVKSSNFNLVGGSTVQFNNTSLALGSPIPTQYNPLGAIGMFVNSSGQFFIGSGSVGAVAGAGTGSWMSFGGTDLNIRAQKLFLNSNGLMIQGADSLAASANVVKLGSSAQNITLNNLQGFYVDGGANLRIGSDVSGSDYLQFVANSSLTLKSTNFNLVGGSTVQITNTTLALGSPIPTQYNPLGAIGMFANSSGQFFVGSGSVGSTAGAGTGSWMSFGGTDLNIRAQKLFLNSNGLMIQGADSLVASANVIKLGASAQNITLNNLQGLYVDGGANLRIGSDVSGSDYLQFVADSSLTIKSTNFNLVGGSTVQITNTTLALGNPIPNQYNPLNKVGLYANSSGQVFIGSGSVGAVAGAGTGSWISFGGTDLNIRAQKLFLASNGLFVQGADNSSSLANVIKLGAAAQNITLNNRQGFYVDGGGNFRVGSDISGSDYLQVVAGSSLTVSSSQFSLVGGSTLKINNSTIALGSPIPTAYNPAGAVGLYANSSGQIFIGSGSVGTTGGAGTGSWVSFGGTDINIRTQKFFVSSSGLIIQGANDLSGMANVIKLGVSASVMGLNSGSQGVYMDGAGNVRIGKDPSTSSEYLQWFGGALVVKASNFQFLANDGTNTLALTPYSMSMGANGGVPSVYNPTSAKGVLINSAGQFFFGSGSVTNNLGNWMNFDGSNLTIRGSITIIGGNAAKTDFSNVTANYAGSTTVGGSAIDTLAVSSLSSSLIAGRLNGQPVVSNPQFEQGLTNVVIYNNNGGTAVSHSLMVNASTPDGYAPNSSGQCLKIDANSTASLGISPGLGGFCWNIGVSTTTYPQVNSYRKGATIIWRVVARIPVGYSINWASNTAGVENSFAWATSTAGTGAWATYVGKFTVGVTAPFNSTGFWYLTGPAGGVTWYVAVAEGVDTNAPDATYSVIRGFNLPSITPTVSGLYMSANALGFYEAGGAGWKSYIDNSGNFLFKGNADNMVQWDGSTLSVHATSFKMFTSTIKLDSTANSGYMALGAASAYGTGKGFYADGSGNGTFRVGDPAGAQMTWDGTSLTVGGTITANSFTATTSSFTGLVKIGDGVGLSSIQLVGPSAPNAYIYNNGGRIETVGNGYYWNSIHSSTGFRDAATLIAPTMRISITQGGSQWDMAIAVPSTSGPGSAAGYPSGSVWLQYT